jgi:hypothetical protein
MMLAPESLLSRNMDSSELNEMMVSLSANIHTFDKSLVQSWIDVLVRLQLQWQFCGQMWIDASDRNVAHVLYACLKHYHTAGMQCLLKHGYIRNIWQSRFWENNANGRRFFQNNNRFMRRTISRQLSELPAEHETVVARSLIKNRREELVCTYIQCNKRFSAQLLNECIKERLDSTVSLVMDSQLYHEQFCIEDWFNFFVSAYNTYRRSNVSAREAILSNLVEGFKSYARSFQTYPPAELCWCRLCLMLSNNTTFLEVIVSCMTDADIVLSNILACMKQELVLWKQFDDTDSGTLAGTTGTEVSGSVVSESEGTSDSDSQSDSEVSDSDSTSGTEYSFHEADGHDEPSISYVQMYENLHSGMQRNGECGIFQALEQVCGFRTDDTWPLICNALRWGSVSTVRWLIQHSSSLDTVCYSFSMNRTHNLLSLSMYNSSFNVMKTLLFSLSQSELQKSLAFHKDIFHGASRFPYDMCHKLNSLLYHCQRMRVDLTGAKGGMLQSFWESNIDAYQRKSSVRRCFQRIMELPAVFGPEYIYGYIKCMFLSKHDVACFGILLDRLVTRCQMRNLPRLFFLLLHDGRENEANMVKRHPLFKHEITCQSDRFRCSMLLYTLRLKREAEIEDWFKTMTKDWTWKLGSVIWEIGTEPLAWWAVAMKYGLRMGFVSVPQQPHHGKMKAAYDALRRRMVRQHLANRLTRHVRLLHYEMLCHMHFRALSGS